MPPFDYHPPPANIVPAPKVPQATPSPLQKVYLRDVDTGPDSAKGARFRRTPLEDLPAALPDTAPRAIFTEKLLRHERDHIMPYVHSEKVTGHAVFREDGSVSATGDDATKEEEDDEEEEERRKRRKRSIAGESPSPSAGTDLQLDGGAMQVPASLLDTSSSTTGTKEPLQDGDASAATAAAYVKTPIPGLVFDTSVTTTVRNAYLPVVLGVSAVVGVFLLAGFGTWGTARIVDLGVLLLAGAYVLFVAPTTSVAGLMGSVRDTYRSNPTLWQSALLALVFVYAAMFLLDMASLMTFVAMDVTAWVVAVTHVVFLAAKHWAGVDLFDLFPAAWFAGGDTKAAEPQAEAEAEEVYHVAQNVYTYGEAAQVCASLDAKLASYDQIEDAYARGAEWCGYGWSEGQMAFFPTQKATWRRLQQQQTSSSSASSPEQKQACGRPGVNGGYMTNPDLKFGVNCFGVKPARTSGDVTAASAAQVPETGGGGKTQQQQQYPRQSLRLQSFNRTQWSESGQVGGGTHESSGTNKNQNTNANKNDDTPAV